MNHWKGAYRGVNTVGAYVATLLLFLAGWLLLGNLPLLAAMLAKGVTTLEDLAAVCPENVYLLLMLSSFAIGLLVLILCIRVFHRRGFRMVANGGRPLRWGHFLTAFGLYFLAMAIVQGRDLLWHPENFEWQFDAAAFVRALPVLLLFVPLQTLFEEFFFRGYLMQSLVVGTKRVWIAWLLSALLFGFAHSANPEVGAYGYTVMMLQYLLFGLLFGWFALADEGIEVSWGMHTANNLFLLLFVTEEHSALPTPALWRQLDATPSLKDIFQLLFLVGVLWVVLERIYRWKLPSLRKIANPGEEETPAVENKEVI